ncbi:unnamed protein product [Urochloa humidicola]
MRKGAAVGTGPGSRAAALLLGSTPPRGHPSPPPRRVASDLQALGQAPVPRRRRVEVGDRGLRGPRRGFLVGDRGRATRDLNRR